MPKTETLNLRISAEFKKRLMEEAAKEKRSVTNYVESTLTALWEARYAMEAREKTKHR